ncbi:5-methylcytosine-specific restriction endonuclease system specificity protein McrC, partial [Enterobacter cloacae complex sp. 742-ADZ3-9B]
MTDLAERDDTHARAAVSRIPLRNIWLLMLYASSLFRHHGRSMVAAENNPEEIPALVARILLHEVEQRLLRHLSMGYQTRRATLNRVRGRIDVLRTTSRQLLERAQVACQFQEMTLDTPRNRYVRSALEHLVPLLSNGPLAAQCRAMAINLRRRGIEGGMPSKGELPSITRFGRHDAADKAMVDAAKL